jgi:hypothetical protein
MTTLKQALGIITGDVVHDMGGRTLKVGNYTISFEKGEPINAYFTCVDINDPTWHFTYQYNEIYQNFEDLSDEHKSFLLWIRDTKVDKFLGYMYNDDIKDLKDSYIAGFAAGFQYRKIVSSQEQLQK